MFVALHNEFVFASARRISHDLDAVEPGVRHYGTATCINTLIDESVQ